MEDAHCGVVRPVQNGHGLGFSLRAEPGLHRRPMLSVADVLPRSRVEEMSAVQHMAALGNQSASLARMRDWDASAVQGLRRRAWTDASPSHYANQHHHHLSTIFPSSGEFW